MNINYKERYQLLLNQIKKRIKSNNLSDVIKEIYSKYIQIIEENIDESATENEYDNAINLLLITLDEIKELEAKTKESEEQSKILEEQINKLGYAQSLTQKRINTHKKNIVSYMLALAIFIGIPTGMYMKARNTPKEKEQVRGKYNARYLRGNWRCLSWLDGKRWIWGWGKQQKNMTTF